MFRTACSYTQLPDPTDVGDKPIKLCIISESPAGPVCPTPNIIYDNICYFITPTKDTKDGAGNAWYAHPIMVA